MKAPYRPFYYWLLRQPFDVAAIAFGIVFSWMSSHAAVHCISQFGHILWAVGVGKLRFYREFPDSWLPSQKWLYAGCYVGFALLLISQKMKRRPKRFTTIYVAQVMVLIAVWIADRLALGLDANFLAIGRMAKYRSLTFVHHGSFSIEEPVVWLNLVGFWVSCVTIATFFQFLFSRLGWLFLRPSFKLRGSLFMRAWAYASLASGPVFFVFYALMGCVYWVITRSGTYDFHQFWFIAWPVYSLLAPVLIAACLVRRRAQRLWHRCERCGYSLRGNVSGRCPECGSPVRTPLEKA